MVMGRHMLASPGAALAAVVKPRRCAISSTSKNRSPSSKARSRNCGGCRSPTGINIAEEVARLTEKADQQLRATYAKLTAWQKTQVARHPDRPKALRLHPPR